MCEIVRALAASGKFTGVNDIQIVPLSITNEIDCAGTPGIYNESDNDRID